MTQGSSAVAAAWLGPQGQSSRQCRRHSCLLRRSAPMRLAPACQVIFCPHMPRIATPTRELHACTQRIAANAHAWDSL